MFRRLPSSLVFLALLAFANTGFTEEPLWPPHDQPGHWRYVTYDPATTTSHCIGQRSTPMCTVETALACFLHGGPLLCPDESEVVLHPAHYRDGSVYTTTIKYRFVAWKRIRAKDLRADYKDRQYLKNPSHGGYIWKIDDIVINLLITDCTGKFDQLVCGVGLETATTYLLRRAENEWRLVDVWWPGPFEGPRYRL